MNKPESVISLATIFANTNSLLGNDGSQYNSRDVATRKPKQKIPFGPPNVDFQKTPTPSDIITSHHHNEKNGQVMNFSNAHDLRT